ncbi:hypothetical protein scyTo_0005736 [Scyliorhinus torazame]|uniref:Uncharacterized protein n=1 Tax=Scyliorhinus torazame TaxID=75743 RepID=A0A401PC18_SCYTO|nr:hypothetical protein [Scyliorhinus torazame]
MGTVNLWPGLDWDGFQLLNERRGSNSSTFLQNLLYSQLLGIKDLPGLGLVIQTNLLMHLNINNPCKDYQVMYLFGIL